MDSTNTKTIDNRKITIFYNENQNMAHMVDKTTAEYLPIVKIPKMVVENTYMKLNLGCENNPEARMIERKSDWEPLTEEEISVAHDRDYVREILACNKPTGFGCILESAAKALPWESASFYRAAEHAVRYRSATMSPTGAFHHAEYANVMAFCTFNGLIISAILLKERDLIEKVGIVDFDVHYPNGTIQIMDKLKLDFIREINFYDEMQRMNITSTMCKEWFDSPLNIDKLKDEAIQYSEGFFESIEDTPSNREIFDTVPQIRDWLSTLYQTLEEKIANVDVIFFQAGADAHRNDPSGGFLTEMNIKTRDYIVFKYAQDKSIPIVWNLAGGYQPNKGKILSIHYNTFFQAIYAGWLAGIMDKNKVNIYGYAGKLGYVPEYKEPDWEPDPFVQTRLTIFRQQPPDPAINACCEYHVAHMLDEVYSTDLETLATCIERWIALYVEPIKQDEHFAWSFDRYHYEPCIIEGGEIEYFEPGPYYEERRKSRPYFRVNN